MAGDAEKGFVNSLTVNGVPIFTNALLMPN